MDITGIGSIFDFGSKVLDKIFPNKDDAERAKLALLELQQRGELTIMATEAGLLSKQADINLEEAKSEKWWKAGPRPFIMWVCGFALFYNYIFMPFFVYGCQLYNTSAPGMPLLESGELMTLLLGMLGIGGMRSYDKKNAPCGSADGGS